MKKTAIALALALTLTGALTACGKDRPAEPNGGGSGVSAGQVTRRYDRARDYLDDGQYTAGTDGRVRSGDGNPATRDLTRDARDLARGAKKGAEDLGRAAARAWRSRRIPPR